MAQFDLKGAFEGLLLGGASPEVANRIEQQREKVKAEAQKTDYLRKLIALENPDAADMVKIMGGPELAAVHDAMASARVRKKEDLQMNRWEQEIAALKQEQAAQDALRAAMAQAGTETATLPGNVTNQIDPGSSPLLGAAMPDSTLTVNSPITRERLLAAMATNPQAVNTRVGGSLLEQAMQGEGAETFFNRNDPMAQDIPGLSGFKRVVTGPNTSQLLAAFGEEAKALPITGPQGEQLGYGLPTRSGVQPLKEPDKLTARDRLQDISRQISAIQRVPKPLRGASDEQLLTDLLEERADLVKQPAAARNAAAPLALPKSKADLKKGKQYQTARGVATWDGEKFTQ